MSKNHKKIPQLKVPTVKSSVANQIEKGKAGKREDYVNQLVRVLLFYAVIITLLVCEWIFWGVFT